MTFKCISLWQPWASLWAAGIKKYDTRSWCTGYRGMLLVHASAAWHPEVEPLFTETFFALALRVIGCRPEIALTLPRGAIVGRVQLDSCRPANGFDVEPREAAMSTEC